MAVIGMGKQKGAEAVHRDGFYELGKMLPIIAKKIFDNTKVLAGLAPVSYTHLDVYKRQASHLVSSSVLSFV